MQYPSDVGHEDVNLLLELLVELKNFEEALEVSQIHIYEYEVLSTAKKSSDINCLASK